MGVGYAVLLSVLLLLAGLLVGDTREASAPSAVWSDHSGADPYVPQGVSVNTSAFARYLICSLPLLLILIAEGIDWLARHVWIRGGAAVVAWCLTTLIVLCWMPNIQFQFFAKKQWPYAKVAKFLHRQMQKRDVIVSGWNIGFTL